MNAMNEDPNNQPPAPDPFEAIAQQLATLAAGMIQIAGQIAKLKDAQQPPPPPPAPEPEPEEQPEPEPEKEPEQDEQDAPEKDAPEKDAPEDKASDDQPTHEDGQGGEKDEPQQDDDEAAQDKPQGEPEQSDESNATEDDQPAESSADEQGEESASDESGELDDQPDAPAEPENGESEGQGEGQGEESSDGEPDGAPDEEGDNDSKGTAAQLPPDLPPVDSTLANCSPPPPPEATPYRPLTPVAKKVADILTAALGKRFALPRPNRHTGALSSAAIARHAPDPFSRRPKQDGKRPKLTMLVDTSGSMTLVRRMYGSNLMDGLLEAHRRRVIDLRLYDAYTALNAYKCKAECDEAGLFNEALVKQQIERKTEHGSNFAKNGILQCTGGSEGFAGALRNLLPVIRESDATILFTDGHWTDGALDKNEYTRNGIEVIGLYIQPAINAVAGMLANYDGMTAELKTDAERHAIVPVLKKYRDSLSSFYQVATAYQSASMRHEVACATLDTGRDEVKQMLRELNKEISAASDAHNEAYKIVDKDHRQITDFFYIAQAKAGAGSTLQKMYSEAQQFQRTNAYGMSPHQMIDASASSKAQLEMNSHRSYATPDALTAAQAIVQEIAMQIASH
jgi:hypothetical protein